MLIKLSNHLLKHPKKHYEEWEITDEEWKKIVYKRNYLEYTLAETHEYVRVILKKEIPPYTLNRLLTRHFLHIKAQSLINQGESEVDVAYFHPYEKFVIEYYD